MTMHSFTISAAQLALIPVKERALLFVMGRGLNELNILARLLYFATLGGQESDPLWKKHGMITQCMLLGRTHVSKVNEMWSAIQTGYFQTQLSKKHVPDSSKNADAAEALKQLKAYFAVKDNLVDVVRNRFAFHYDINAAGIDVPSFVPDEELALYVDPGDVNPLYQFAEFSLDLALREVIIKTARTRLAAGGKGHALLDDENAENIHVAGVLLDEVKLLTLLMNRFGQWVMVAIIEASLGGGLGPGKPYAEAKDFPDATGVRLPYFVNFPRP